MGEISHGSGISPLKYNMAQYAMALMAHGIWHVQYETSKIIYRIGPVQYFVFYRSISNNPV